MVFEIPTEVLDSCGELAGVLAVSKMCCLVCSSAVDYTIRELGSADRNLVMPARHTSWTTTTLPPWTPHEMAAELIDIAWAELKSRIGGTLVNQITRRSESSRQKSKGDR